MRRPLIAGNWKMHGSKAMVDELLPQLRAGVSQLDAEVVVCPPYPYLHMSQRLLDGSAVQLGAQNADMHASGAFTGEVAANMLAEFGVNYVLLGHSERRSLFGETDAQVLSKFLAVQAEGICPVLCVGETLTQYENEETFEVITQQVDAVFGQLDVQALGNAVIAYEPVWAIGTGKTATPEYAQRVHQAIREQIAVYNASIAEQMRILYGGSVKSENAERLFAMSDVDGALVGGASLKAKDFIEICCAAG